MTSGRAVTSGGTFTSDCDVTSGGTITSGGLGVTSRGLGESLPGDWGLVVMSLPVDWGVTSGGLGTSYRILRYDWLLSMTVTKVT